MDFLDLVTKRHSVRIYQDRDVTDHDLKKILETVRLAPSAFNTQAFKFLIYRDQEMRNKLAEATGMTYIKQAPVAVIAVGLDTTNKYNETDVAIALDHLQLAAAEIEIGSVWVGTMGHDKVDELVGPLPENSKVYAVMPLGYDAGKAMPKTRKDFEKLFSFDKFN